MCVHKVHESILYKYVLQLGITHRTVQRTHTESQRANMFNNYEIIFISFLFSMNIDYSYVRE